MKILPFLLLLCAAPLHAQVEQTSLVAGLSAENYPRVGGSSSTSPLGELLASRVWNAGGELRRGRQFAYQSPATISLSFPTDSTPEQIDAFWARFYRNHQHTGTHKDYEALIKGQKDLILVARKPSSTEVALAAKQKVALELRPIALDGLVFLVNAQNGVKNLSRAQLQSVFSGKTKLWRSLGGADFPILALTRNEDSGSQELFDSQVLNGQKLLAPAPNSRLTSMGELIDRVAANRNAIGYSVFYFERFMAPREKNRVLSIDGIAPSRASFANGTYPFTSPVYAVVRGGLKTDSPTLKLRDWLLTSEGQKLIAQSGYVPMKP